MHQNATNLRIKPPDYTKIFSTSVVNYKNTKPSKEQALLKKRKKKKHTAIRIDLKLDRIHPF